MPKINFTKTALENIDPPKSGRTEYLDTKISGLMLRVTANGVKTFSFRKRILNGRLIRATIGKFPDISVETARKKALTMLTETTQGEDPSKVKRLAKKEKTFDDLFLEYLERHSKPNKTTWAEDLSKYNAHIKPALGHLRHTEIDRRHVASIHSKITAQGHPTTANRVLALISSVFNWGRSVGIVETNPSEAIKKNREKARERFLNAEELERFFKALEQETNDTVRDFFLLSLATGARRSNVLTMKWDEISFADKTWQIPMTKNGTSQIVMLAPEAIQILENRKKISAISAFVFPGSGKTGHLVEPKSAWKRILDRAELEDVRIHDLRRTFGSWQANTGASLPIIGKSLNHKNIVTTTIYARLQQDPVRESVNKAVSTMFQKANIKNSTV